MRRVIFGGSFDPVHNGHVNIVRSTAAALEADEVIIMPTSISPFKQGMERRPASGADRLEMCRLAFADMNIVTVSDFELLREGVSYTVDTVKHFRGFYPDDELFLLIGSDMLLSFGKWRSFDEILSLCTLCAASREDGEEDMPQLEEAAEKLREYGNVLIIKTEPFETSSTEIREKILKNCDISCYVPENVVKYISDKGLYNSV